MKVERLHDLSPIECAKLSRSVWRFKDVMKREKKRKWFHVKHGATYPLYLATRVVKIYSKKGDWILDPFLGTGTTLVAAKQLDRNGYGFELYEKWYSISKRELSQESIDSFVDGKRTEIKAFNESCFCINKRIPPETVQLTFTSPPYADFILRSVEDRKVKHKESLIVNENNSTAKQYGTSDLDFGNMDYDTYLENVTGLMKMIHDATKTMGYNIWVVKDHRDPTKNKPYIPLHVDIAKAAEKAGFTWVDLITWDQNEQRKLVLLGYPSTFYVNINHTFLVVTRKMKNKKEG